MASESHHKRISFLAHLQLEIEGLLAPVGKFIVRHTPESVRNNLSTFGELIWQLPLLTLCWLSILLILVIEKATWVANDPRGLISWTNSVTSDGLPVFLCGALLLASCFLRQKWARFLVRLPALLILIAMLADMNIRDLFSTRMNWDDVLPYLDISSSLTVLIQDKPLLLIVLLALPVAIPIVLTRRMGQVPYETIALGSATALSLLLFMFNNDSSTSPSAWQWKNILTFNNRDIDRSYSQYNPDEYWYPVSGCTALPGQIPQYDKIMLVVVESLSSYQSMYFSGLNNWTPELDALAEKGQSLNNFHANGFNTAGGLVALLAGDIPIQPPAKIEWRFSFSFLSPLSAVWGYIASIPSYLGDLFRPAIQAIGREMIAADQIFLRSGVDLRDIGLDLKSAGLLLIGAVAEDPTETEETPTEATTDEPADELTDQTAAYGQIPILNRLPTDQNDSLLNLLRRQGYRSHFVTSGNLDFSGKADWLKLIGFDELEGDEHAAYDGHRKFIFNSSADEHLYRRVLRKLEEVDDSWFMVIETTSSHAPYIDPVSGQASLEKTIRYADQQLGTFVRQLEQTDFFIQGGLLIVTSDHRSMNRIGPEEFNLRKGRAESWIPLVMYDQNQSRWLRSQNARLYRPGIQPAYQQIDLYNGLRSLISQESCPTPWRGDLISKKPAQCQLYTPTGERSHLYVNCTRQQFIVNLKGDQTESLLKKQLPDWLNGQIAYWRNNPPLYRHEALEQEVAEEL